MTIIKKRIVFFMMALLTGLLLTTAFQPFAQAVESPTISTPAAIQGLDEYISTSPTGAFTLNEDAALTDGYSQEAINMVEHQLFIMNDLSRSKNSVVDSTTLTVTIYQSSARARGVNKYIVHWNGLTERWMDSDNTKAYIRGLETGGNVSKFVPGWVGSMAKLYSASSIAQAKQAAKPGRGINVHPVLDNRHYDYSEYLVRSTMSFVQPARMRRLACFGVQHNGSHISSSSSHWCAGLRSLGIFLFSRNHPCLWARTFGLCYGVRSV